jgi:hypothetical protein
MKGIKSSRKGLVSIIVTGVFATGLVNSISLVSAYLEINSPTDGQQIPVGSTFNIKGTSTVANDSSHCIVDVIINGIRPYHKAIPTGTNGTDDYTTWQFIPDPSYATVKSGQNKITARYSCFPNSDTSNTQPSFLKHLSVNITGVGQQPQQSSLSPTPSSPLTSPSSSNAATENSGGKIVKEPAHSKIIK